MFVNENKHFFHTKYHAYIYRLDRVWSVINGFLSFGLGTYGVHDQKKKQLLLGLF